MFDITQIFAAIAGFFAFMLALWKRNDEAKKKKLYDSLAEIKKKIIACTDEVELNKLLEQKKEIERQIALLKG